MNLLCIFYSVFDGIRTAYHKMYIERTRSICKFKINTIKLLQYGTFLLINFILFYYLFDFFSIPLTIGQFLIYTYLSKFSEKKTINKLNNTQVTKLNKTTNLVLGISLQIISYIIII